MRQIGTALCVWLAIAAITFAQTQQHSTPPTQTSAPEGVKASLKANAPESQEDKRATSLERRPLLKPAMEKFGYSYFKQAREALDLRRHYFQLLLQGALPTGTALPVGLLPTTPPQTEGSAASKHADKGVAPAQLAPPAPMAPHGSTALVPAGTQPHLVYPYGTTPASGTPFVLPPADALRNFVGPHAMLWMNVLMPAPERYQLGAGDLLTLRYWSETLEPNEVSLRIDQQGVLVLPTGARLVARGQTLPQLEETIRKTLARVIRNVQLTLTLRELRTMTVIVAGEAYAPGSYQVPAVATLFNMLYACGGPNDNGSLRQIQLRRTDGSHQTFDFYRFLLDGDGSVDVPLQPGDIIFIPAAEIRVSVSGEVRRPAVYELLPEDRLRNVLRFAGGVKPSGVAQRVAVASVRPGVAFQRIDVNLLDTGEENNPQLYDGDQVEVYSIRPTFINVVTIDGAVDQPGNYALTPGMTVADLIERARGVLEDAYLERADLFRTNPDNTQMLIPVQLSPALQRDPQHNIPLQWRDRLVVYAIKDVEWMGVRRVEISGAVQKPGTYYRADNMRVQDLLLQAGGVLPEAYVERAFLQRQNPDGSYGPLLAIDLRKAMLNDSEHNAELQDRDKLMVYTKQQAQFTPENVVRIEGAVQAPGEYPRAENMRVSDLVRLAGGLLPQASTRAEIAHARTPVGTPPEEVDLKSVLAGNPAQDILLQDGDVVTIRARGDFLLKPQTVFLQGKVKEPGPYTLTSPSERLSELVKRAGGLLSTAYPQAARLMRRPEQVISETQNTLTSRMLQVLQIVNEEEYRRALARSDVERVRFAAGVSQPPLAIAPSGIGLAGGTSQPSLKPEELTTLFSRDLVSPARPLKQEDLLPSGNVRINMVAALNNPGSNEDIELRDGDIIFVPEKPTTVAVTGAVVVPSAVLHQPNRGVFYYIQQAGGLTSDAARDRILVIRASGDVIPARQANRLDAGDIIFVPTRVMAERLRDRQAELDAAIRSLTSGAIVYEVFRRLIR